MQRAHSRSAWARGVGNDKDAGAPVGGLQALWRAAAARHRGKSAPLHADATQFSREGRWRVQRSSSPAKKVSATAGRALSANTTAWYTRTLGCQRRKPNRVGGDGSAISRWPPPWCAAWGNAIAPAGTKAASAQAQLRRKRARWRLAPPRQCAPAWRTPCSVPHRRARVGQRGVRHGKRRAISITAQQRGVPAVRPPVQRCAPALSGLQGSMTCRGPPRTPPHCANSAPGCKRPGPRSQRCAGNNHPSCFHAAIIGNSPGARLNFLPRHDSTHSLDVDRMGVGGLPTSRTIGSIPGARYAHPSAERRGPCAGRRREQEGHHGYEALVGKRGRCSVCGSGRLVYPGHRPRRRAPSTFVLLDGSSQTTADLRGKVTLVNFWATSCTTCVAEMPKSSQPSSTAAGLTPLRSP